MTINLAAKKMKIEDNMKYNGRWEGNLIGSKHKLYEQAKKEVFLAMKLNQKPLRPRNPNKRLCVARNITFTVQKENEHWLRLLSKRPYYISQNRL
ncbi:MAG: hypothetical protein K0Q87_4290 [Neobacillus sp.]|jgi:hypothetical protein|nr:hypothetical protein [Neobacillus sp.]